MLSLHWRRLAAVASSAAEAVVPLERPLSSARSGHLLRSHSRGWIPGAQLKEEGRQINDYQRPLPASPSRQWMTDPGHLGCLVPSTRIMCPTSLECQPLLQPACANGPAAVWVCSQVVSALCWLWHPWVGHRCYSQIRLGLPAGVFFQGTWPSQQMISQPGRMCVRSCGSVSSHRCMQTYACTCGMCISVSQWAVSGSSLARS